MCVCAGSRAGIRSTASADLLSGAAGDVERSLLLAAFGRPTLSAGAAPVHLNPAPCTRHQVHPANQLQRVFADALSTYGVHAVSTSIDLNWMRRSRSTAGRVPSHPIRW